MSLKKFKRSALSLALGSALLTASMSAQSQYSIIVNNHYEFMIMEPGESDAEYGIGGAGVPLTTLDPRNIEAWQYALDYYDVLYGKYIKTKTPVKIKFAPLDVVGDNAGAESIENRNASSKSYTMTNFTSALFYDEHNSDPVQGDAFIYVFANYDDWRYDNFDSLTSFPDYGLTGGSMANTLTHELAHALGMNPSTLKGYAQGYAQVPATRIDYFDSNVISKFAQNLHDINGNATRPGMYIFSEAEYATLTPELQQKTFVVKKRYQGNGFSSDQGKVHNAGVYYTSDRIKEVIGENTLLRTTKKYDDDLDYYVPGIPINGFENRAEFMHVELRNVNMSHLYWRNYNILVQCNFLCDLSLF